MDKMAAVYIVTNRRNGTLYIGSTTNLAGRIFQHKQEVYAGFTKKYGLHHLVWYEVTDSVIDAITRERQMKKWNRSWKINLIVATNPQWDDLGGHLL